MIDPHDWPTPHCKKVAILLAECGLAYRLVRCNIGPGLAQGRRRHGSSRAPPSGPGMALEPGWQLLAGISEQDHLVRSERQVVCVAAQLDGGDFAGIDVLVRKPAVNAAAGPGFGMSSRLPLLRRRQAMKSIPCCSRFAVNTVTRTRPIGSIPSDTNRSSALAESYS